MQIELIYSQVGYDADKAKLAFVAGEIENGTFVFSNSVTKEVLVKGNLVHWGLKWEKNWYQIDFSEVTKPGEYTLQIFVKDEVVAENKNAIHIRRDALWNRCWYDCSLGQLDVRATNCYPEGGWRDCGSELQEVSSHIIMLEAVCDLLSDARVPSCEREHLLEHVYRGADYILKCRKEHGGFVHELHHNPNVSFGNCANAVSVLGRVSLLTKQDNPEKSKEYLASAKKAYEFATTHDFFSDLQENTSLQSTHDAPEEMKTPPAQHRTRDLLSLLQATLSLYKCGDEKMKDKAFSLTEEILSRQIPEEKAQHGLFGHFYTFSGYDFSEKANYHCGAWDLPYKNYNQGAHKPYWVMPLFEMMELFPEHKDLQSWKNALKNFAYGFFKPACEDNPFGIIPAGVYNKDGILYFSGLYHGHAKIYGYAAVLATKFYQVFKDADFLSIATANMQWVAGLNVQGISFIVDIGENSAKDWNVLRGTIINGFDSSKQFSIAPVSAETDLPSYLDDEGAIHHCAGFVSGLCATNSYLL